MPDRSRTILEVQVHPADIRGKVRYLFLSRRQLTWFSLGFLSWATLIGSGVALSFDVIPSLMRAREYEKLLDRRGQQGRRLAAFVERFDELEGETTELRIQMQKVYSAYGLNQTGAAGKGGFPFESEIPSPGPAEAEYASEITQGARLRAIVSQELEVIGTFLEEIRSFEAAHTGQLRTTPSICPLKGDDFVLTSPFGTRRSPFTKEIDFHAGIDLAAPVGTSVVAPADGVVVFAGRYPLRQSVGWWRYGNLVVLRHGDSLITLYGHNDEVVVERGDAVEQGDPIATVGNTGWSTSPHLHYEVRRRFDDNDVRPVDPRIYILDRRWRDEEELLVRARQAPGLGSYEPLPSIMARR